MKLKQIMRLFFVSLGSLISMTAMAQNALWTGNPIELSINVNEERRIDFPENIVDIDVSPQIHSQTDILLTPEGRLFWKPKSTYDASRIKAVSVTGTLYLLDIAGVVEGGSKETVTIIDPAIGQNPHTIVGDKYALGTTSANMAFSQSSKIPQGLPDFLKRNNNEPKESKRVGNDYIGMTRFVLSHYAGPKRLIPKMNASIVNTGSIPRNWVRMAGSKLQTKVLKGWLIDGHYVTAIYVKNQTNLPIEFDPRAFRGKFQFAGSLNPYLEPKGNLGDEGLWVFISTTPFSQAARSQ